jgi:hypothetical protein
LRLSAKIEKKQDAETSKEVTIYEVYLSDGFCNRLDAGGAGSGGRVA